MRRALILTLVLAASTDSQAQELPAEHSDFFVVPASPTTRDPIVVRNEYSGCRHSGPISADEIAIDLAARVVDYYLPEANDLAGCAPADFLQGVHADSTVGFLPAGTYTLRFISCGIMGDPDATCGEVSSLRTSFTVMEAGRPRHTIPTLGDTLKLALAAVLAIAGLALLRPRR